MAVAVLLPDDVHAASPAASASTAVRAARFFISPLLVWVQPLAERLTLGAWRLVPYRAEELRLDLVQSMRPQVLEIGLATATELDDLDAAARAHLDNPHTVVMSGLLFLTWGHKPIAHLGEVGSAVQSGAAAGAAQGGPAVQPRPV